MLASYVVIVNGKNFKGKQFHSYKVKPLYSFLSCKQGKKFLCVFAVKLLQNEVAKKLKTAKVNGCFAT